ncbi:MAG: Spx/MgsR family RNA polymerase-binding regulatory protein [Campylobacterales bacterium]|nr:Spx/MgsR family RNA polymerase-binding regulatory protein [Campylobacterales bacterium]
MITIYGISTCSTVKKAIKFCKENNLEHTFVDFRKTPLEDSKIDQFLNQIPLEKLFNPKGQKYKELGLKELNLDDSGKIEWLKKENMLFKRPIVQYKNKALVSFNEQEYKRELL